MAATPQSNGKKLIVFVGGSSGLGLAALENLISSDEPYHVVLGSRHELDQAHSGRIDQLLQSHPKSSLNRLPCDFESYASVRVFTETIKTEYADRSLHALVLCAGKIAWKHTETEDREDSTLQVNTLSHALLIDLLKRKIDEDGGKTRVLLVASSTHRKVLPGTVRPDNIDIVVRDEYEYMKVYQISKLLYMYLLFFTHERFADQPNVSVVAVSPGKSATPLNCCNGSHRPSATYVGFVPNTGLNRDLGVFRTTIMNTLMSKMFFATSTTDAGKIIAEGVTHDFPSGTYFSKHHRNERAAEECYDPELRERWKAWFIAKGVWHQGSFVAGQVAGGTEGATSRANAEEARAEWNPNPEPATKMETPTTTSTPLK